MAQAPVQESRAFQDDKLYHLPKDAPEHDRLDAQSASIAAILGGKTFLATPSNPKRVLDIGCGTGTMTHQLAQKYPEAEVIGIDLAPVPESRFSKLPNLHYVQGDYRDLIGKDPRFQAGSFDYVFERLLMFGMSDWPAYIALSASLLRPGGSLEFQEITMQLVSASGERLMDAMPWYVKFREDATAGGLDVETGAKVGAMFEAEPTLENVRDWEYRVPPKPRKDRPDWDGMTAQLPGLFTVVTTNVCSQRRSEEEVKEIVSDMRERWSGDFNEGDHFAYHVVVGQKKANVSVL